MTTLALLALLSINTGGLISLLITLAILGIVVWAIFAGAQALGLTLHPIVRILLIALASIVAIILIARLLGVAI